MIYNPLTAFLTQSVMGIPSKKQRNHYSGYTQADLDGMSTSIISQQARMEQAAKDLAAATTQWQLLVNQFGACNCTTLHNNNCFCTDASGQVVERDQSNVFAGRVNINVAAAKKIKLKQTLDAETKKLQQLREQYDTALEQYIKQQEASMTPEQKIALEKQRADNAAALAQINASASTKTILYIGGAVVAVFAIGTAIYFYFKKKSS